MSRKSKPPEEPPSDYEVGRGKPPKHTRFPPGKSANPGGRKKGSQNTKTLLKAVMQSEIQVTEQGKARKVSMLTAIMLAAAKNALKGNQRACEFLIQKAEALDDQQREAITELSEEDAVLLEAYTASRLSTSGSMMTPKNAAGDADDNADDDDSSDDEEPV